MSLFPKIKPAFWDIGYREAGPYRHSLRFRRMWYLVVILTASVSIGPLIAMAFFDYNVTRTAAESEIILRTARLVSNTRRTVTFFLVEGQFALDFVVRDNTYEQLSDRYRLAAILGSLKKTFGGFTDLGVIDSKGLQLSYVGPYVLEGVFYDDQAWFHEVVKRGKYISEVFLGYRHVPHMIVAVKQPLPDGSFFILRATVDTERFNYLLSHLEVDGFGDAYIINRHGILQTPSRSHGNILEKMSLEVPPYSPKTQVYETRSPDGLPLLVGYAYIEETNSILMIVKQKDALMKPWYDTRKFIIVFLVVGITIILIVILGVTTFLVNKTFQADEKRVMALHQVEYEAKLASIGRLAAGVAHEINNPLAIINEKAGLIKDLFNYTQNYQADEKLIGLLDSILSSVERCSRITRRLLGFARHFDLSVQRIDLAEIIDDVLGFLKKEAEYRGIQVHIHIDADVPNIESDRGKLQQILLNLINNSFAAMDDGGTLEVKAQTSPGYRATIRISDNGCGIPEANLNRIFEPFFSTKKESGGTGLGLSITYGLVQELGGEITVQSEAGKGTAFTIILPVRLAVKERPIQ
ncbi:MAG: ATP-binding protein [Proteobacteria bacterium]|nr:ATP-binding protein [Pseudomonadota bacterium]